MRPKRILLFLSLAACLILPAGMGQAAQPSERAVGPAVQNVFRSISPQLQFVVGSFLYSKSPDPEWLGRTLSSLDPAASGAPLSPSQQALAEQALQAFLWKAEEPRSQAELFDVATRLAFLQSFLKPHLSPDQQAQLKEASRLSREELNQKSRERLNEAMRRTTEALGPFLRESLEDWLPGPVDGSENLSKEKPSAEGKLRPWSPGQTEPKPEVPAPASSQAEGKPDPAPLSFGEFQRILSSLYEFEKQPLTEAQRQRLGALITEAQGKGDFLTLTQLAFLTSPNRDPQTRELLLAAIRREAGRMGAMAYSAREALETIALHAHKPIEVVYDEERREYADGRAWIARQLLARYRSEYKGG